MNENTKEKLINRAVYIILAVLLVTVLTLTVIAIVSTVSKRNDLPVDNPPVEAPPNADSTDTVPDENNGGDTVPDTPSDPITEPEPEKPVYVSPCDGGYIQKIYSDSTPVFSATTNSHRVHLGIDIFGNAGDPVRAFSDGTVEKISTDYFMGKTVVIDHGNGLKSYYMNLAEALPEGIEVGKKVAYGTVIGAIGETANLECADSPHLHFELRLGDKHVDPSGYVTLPSLPTSEEDFEE